MQFHQKIKQNIFTPRRNFVVICCRYLSIICPAFSMDLQQLFHGFLFLFISCVYYLFHHSPSLFHHLFIISHHLLHHSSVGLHQFSVVFHYLPSLFNRFSIILPIIFHYNPSFSIICHLFSIIVSSFSIIVQSCFQSFSPSFSISLPREWVIYFN